MLVLSRKKTEAIVVESADRHGVVCRVTVLAIRGGKVRLGIEVDPDVIVLRSEIVDCVTIQKAI